MDGSFWQNFHTLLSMLGEPETLVNLKKESEEQYYSVIEPLVRFISETEAELKAKGHLIEQDFDPAKHS